MGPDRGQVGMDPNQRFKADHPCPVCGGHAGQPQGMGTCCYGFLSDDGLYAHCTREEYAGNLERKPTSDTYAHSLRGLCLCGKEHGVGVATVQRRTGDTQSAPGIDSYRDFKLGKPARIWPYRYSNGTLACHIARWDLHGGGKVIRPLVLENRRWMQKGISRPLPLYNLPGLRDRPDAPVLVVEGEKTSDAAGEQFPSHVATTSMYGAKSPHQSDWTPLEGREVVIWPDNDPEGQLYAKGVAAEALASGASGVRIVQLPKGLPTQWDLADQIPDGLDLERLLAAAEPHVASDEELDAEGEERGPVGRVSARDLLLRWAKELAELYCDGGETFADVLADGRRETLAIRSTGFKQWLRRLYWERTGKGTAQEALGHVVENLDAHAARAGQRKVYLRVASNEGRMYIDLGDDSRRVVEIGVGGWRIMEEFPPVRFRRTPNLRALPVPVRGDAGQGIRALHSFLNVGDDDFVLCVAWLLAALRDTGPYPLLVLTGEWGSAKSTAARLLRSLADPASSPIRGTPKDERDAVIAARRQRVLAYDNLSGLPTWLSDALCRIATGAGFGTRALYTDDEEMVFEVSRPVILTGIGNPVIRGDLADRSMVVTLSQIEDSARRTEAEVMVSFEEVRPLIFGALLDGLSEGLRKLRSVRLERLPRMADFCMWGVACEGAYWPSGTFMAAYEGAQASAIEELLEDSSVGLALRLYLDEKLSFEGNARELLDRLNANGPDEKRPRGWPATGGPMGRQLMRLAPLLRRLGYTAERVKKSRGNVWKLESPAGDGRAGEGERGGAG